MSDWLRFSHDDLKAEVRRSPDGILTPPLVDLTIPGSVIEEFSSWLQSPRPIMPGDFVAFKAGRYSKDAGEVIAVCRRHVWVNVVWKTSQGQSIEPLHYIGGRLTEDEAAERGFRLSERWMTPDA